MARKKRAYKEYNRALEREVLGLIERNCPEGTALVRTPPQEYDECWEVWVEMPGGKNIQCSGPTEEIALRAVKAQVSRVETIVYSDLIQELRSRVSGGDVTAEQARACLKALGDPTDYVVLL